MPMNNTLPSAPRPSVTRQYPTRWEREKAAAYDLDVFEKADDPKCVGPWILGEMIGKGANGRVKIARHRLTQKLAAVKILPFASACLGASPAQAQKHRTSVEREIVMMKLMEHPNIMRLFDVWEGRGNLYLVLEWIKGGELFDLIVERGHLQPIEALVYFKQIIYGVSYCHAFSIAHRDLKLENILVHGSRNELVKIADWGMAAFQTPFTRLETSCGSPHYASPEVIRGEHYDGAKADIWSMGVILFALLAGRLPFEGEDIPGLLSKITIGVFDMPSHIHPAVANLIKRMLVVDVRARISMCDILKHPFLRLDTPGIYHVAPPLTISAPVLSVADIDQDIFSSLRVIFGKHVSADRIQRDLLLDRPNITKAFYVLLLKFRERQLQSRVEDSAKADCEPGLYPYQFSRSERLIGDANSKAACHDSRYPSLRMPTPNYSFPSSGRSLPLPECSRLPVALNKRVADGLTSAKVQNIPKSAHTTSRPSAGMASNALAISLTPPFDDRFPVPPALSRSTARSHVTRPIDLNLAQPRTSQAQTIHGVADTKPQGRETAPVIPVSVCPIASAPAPMVGSTENVLFPMRRGSEIQAFTPRPRPSVQFIKNAIALSSLPVESPVAGAFSPTNRTNLTVQDNAERLRQEIAVLSDPTPNGPLTHKGNMAEDRTPSSVFQPAQAQAKTVSRYSPVHGKENMPDKPDVPVRQRLSNEGPARIPEFFRTPTLRSGYDICRHTVSEENEKIITKEMQRDAAANENGAKRGIIRKNRPANIDVRAALPSVTSTPKALLGAHSATSTPLVFSPVVQEFRGWFSNLFHWKTSTYTLHSPLNCLTTRGETARLLTEFGVSLTLEDTLGFGVLKCKLEDKFEADGSLIQKQVRFRVEFHPYIVPLPVSPAIECAGSPSTPRPGSQFASSMTMIQERGALSTFRNICERLRTEWRLETLYCLDASTNGRVSPSVRTPHVTESVSGFLVIQPARKMA